MPERRIRVTLPTGGTADAVEIGVSEATERWTDIKLEDGSFLRIKAVVMGVVRLEGQFDPDGNPMYMVRANQVMSVSAPDHLRKGGEIPKGVH